MVDVTHDMGLRLQDDITATNWAFNLTVHNYPLGGNTPADMGTSCDHQGSAVKFAFNSSVDFDQALGSYLSHNPQSIGDNGSPIPRREHDHLLSQPSRD
jgi:hypothetical protein